VAAKENEGGKPLMGFNKEFLKGCHSSDVNKKDVIHGAG